MGAGTFNRPPHGYAPHAPQAQPRGDSGLAITGLVFGILAALTFWVWGATIFGPIAIIFGIVGRNDARKNGKTGEGYGTAAIALGIVSMVLMVPWAFIVFGT